MLQSSVLVPQYCQRNVTTRCNIARDLNSTALLDLPTSRVSIFHKRKRQIFFCFLRRKGARERFAMWSTTETGRDVPRLCDI